MKYVYYKNVAIPIRDVLYIRYFPKGKCERGLSGDSNVTRVFLKQTNSPYQYSIDFKGNHVKDLKELLDDGAERYGDSIPTVMGMPPMGVPLQVSIVNKPAETDDKPTDISPQATW